MQQAGASPVIDSCQTPAAQMSSGTELGSPSVFFSLVLRDAAGQSWGLGGARSQRAPDPAAPATPRGQTPSARGGSIGRREEEGPGAGRGCEPLAAPAGVGSALRWAAPGAAAPLAGAARVDNGVGGLRFFSPPAGPGSAAVGGREEERGPPPPPPYKRGRVGGGAACAAEQGRAGVATRTGTGRAGAGQGTADRAPVPSAALSPRPPHPSHPSHPAPPPPARDHAAGAGPAPPRSAARLPLLGDIAGPRRRQGCLLPPRRPPALRRQVQPLHGRLQPAARPRQAREQAQVSDPRPQPRNPSGGHRERPAPGSEPGLRRASLTGSSPRPPGTGHASGLYGQHPRGTGLPRGPKPRCRPLVPSPGLGCGHPWLGRIPRVPAAGIPCSASSAR